MIKKLQKKLTTLLIFLLTIFWIGILLLFLNSTYKNNLKDEKEDVRSALREIKWKNFIRTQGTALDLEDIGYCVFQIDDYKQPHILFQTFTNKTDEELLRYAKKYSLTWKKTHQTYKYIYIYKLRKKQLMLISSAGYHSGNCIMYLSSVWRTDPFYIFFPYYLPLADTAHRGYDQF